MRIPNATCSFLGSSLAAVGLMLMTAAPARADYQSTVLADNPLAYYALNPASDPAGVSPDLTANGNDGASFNLTPATGPSAFITNAAAFDGSDAAVDLSEGTNPGLFNFTGPITMEAWVQPSSTSWFGDIIGKGYDSTQNYDEIVLRANGPYGTSYYGSSGSAGVNGGVQTTAWTHLVLSSDGTTVSLYVNGGLVGRGPDTSGAILFNDAFRIGTGSADGTGRYFSGNISQVAIYNHGLTAAQVQTHYLMGMFGTTSLPVGNSLVWSASANSGVWDAATSANWTNAVTHQQVDFTNRDQVLFNDTTGVPTSVSVNSLVSPFNLTVSSSVNNFTFGGSGAVAGNGSLTKNGNSTLTLNSPFYLTGPVTINGGIVQSGGNNLASASSITITNSTLDFNGGVISSYVPVTVSGAGIGGNGAIINNGSDQYSEVLNVTLAGDTTFGGNGRWDLANGSSISGPHKVIVKRGSSGGYGEWDTVTLGADVGDIELAQGQLGIKGMGAIFGNPSATLTVDSGCQLFFWNSNFGANSGYAKNIHVLTGGVFAVRTSSDTHFDANVTFEDNSQWDYFNGGGSTGQTMNGTYTLNGIAHMLTGDSPITFANVISGTGGFVWDAYNNQSIFTASNTYSGPTVIGGGLTLALSGIGSISHSSLIFFGGNNSGNTSLDVSARTDGTFTLASGQTLGGDGIINGKLAVSVGATISPAGTNVILGMTEGNSSTGTLTANNNVTLNGTTLLKLNGSGVNDQVKSGTSIACSGTLSLANISGSSFANGNSFQILNAPAITGAFTTITPATPGAGLAWDTTQLNSTGFLNVVSTAGPVINTTRNDGGNLIFTGTGGSATAAYVVYTTTNLVTANWVPIQTNNFDGTGGFKVTNAISITTPQLFYRIK